jgi:hypothetical protein
MRRVLILNLLLLAIVAVLVVQIVALWWFQEPEAETVAPREAKAQKIDIPKVDRRPPPPNLATQIADKDLFDASRQAEKAAGTAATGPVSTEPARPLTLVLLGVSGGGPEREALVRDQTQPKPQWIRQGEMVGDYKLGRIDPISIVMVGPQGEEVTLFINVEKAKAGVPQAATGPAGIQPTPTPGAPGTVATRTPRGVMSPGVARTPAADIKEKIERLRQEARKRRGQPAAQ